MIAIRDRVKIDSAYHRAVRAADEKDGIERDYYPDGDTGTVVAVYPGTMHPYHCQLDHDPWALVWPFTEQEVSKI